MCAFGLHFRVYATFAPSSFLILATGIIQGAISSNFCGARIALDRSNWDIAVVTSGPNTKKGEISINCPFCKDDLSFHMGVDPPIDLHQFGYEKSDWFAWQK
jgi:hypothetical protein